MKKKLLITALAAIAGLTIGIYSCAREDGFTHDETNANQIAERAQSFFETSVGAPSLPDTYFKANGGTSTTTITTPCD
jgi:hypothetical protein